MKRLLLPVAFCWAGCVHHDYRADYARCESRASEEARELCAMRVDMKRESRTTRALILSREPQ